MNPMFPLIAITAFFVLGIAFFAIGKDDFGIKRVKEVSNDNSQKGIEVNNQESTLKNESPEENKDLTSLEVPSEINSDSKTSN